ncbi:hypothetical protein [Fusobacterium canifelinum]|uniref:Uncharacterized protein n=1 Tax=Fusobacterium canifelinum TaxID=285729 RepID=A0A3P1UUT8_9FUSO|nr:hypothetical protein [Fusobacterium canifelinum]RRD25582.1 hypothetical protein EII27_05910 [Fusobacterium canifelinum]
MKQTLLKIFEEKMDKERGSYISTWDKYAEELVEVYEKFIKHQPLEEQIIKLLSISYGDSFLNTGIYNAFKNNNMQLLHDTHISSSRF